MSGETSASDVIKKIPARPAKAVRYGLQSGMHPNANQCLFPTHPFFRSRLGKLENFQIAASPTNQTLSGKNAVKKQSFFSGLDL